MKRTINVELAIVRLRYLIKDTTVSAAATRAELKIILKLLESNK